MNTIPQLVQDVAAARQRFVDAVGTPTPAQAEFRPSPDAWSVTENVEHMVLAEQGGINSIWKALDGVRNGRPAWAGELAHRGRSIEAVVAQTWAEREQVPAVAAPRWGGPVAYWTAALRACQPLLEALAAELVAAERAGLGLERIVYPHPISGPLDARQRLEFLRFHLDRHRGQVDGLKAHPDYPKP